jgi:exodeoxyribonuclease V gamma subunit
MFSLIHGNRQDLLARLLAHRLKSDPPPLFEAEVVLIQSEAMARWVRLVLAEELGIAAQLRFPFPAGYLWELFAAVLPDVPARSPFSVESLHWRLLRLLALERPQPEFAALRRFLADGDVSRRDSLAQKLAETFERYLAYRPDWLAAWAQHRLCHLGADEVWQAQLWRELMAEVPTLPEVHPRDAFLAALAANPGLAARLPRRISLFGIGAMPPDVFEVFRELGRYIDVTLYLLNPCRAHWGDLVAARVRARAALETPGAAVLLETGHPVLGSLGTVARQFFDRVSEKIDTEITAFEDVPSATVLRTLQADMLDLHALSQVLPQAVAVDDDSLQIHVCHSPMREVDVLHDRLLALFEARPELRPTDVLVLTPDLETYAPLIEARFGAGVLLRGAGQGEALSSLRLPFTIADRPPTVEAPLLRAFTALLSVAQGRLEAEKVLGFLEHPPVARRWGFDGDDIEQLRLWVQAAGIRWGIDGAWRAARNLPAEDAHGWRQGFERLLLGMALPEVDSTGTVGTTTLATPLFQGRLPAAAIEGSGARVLGRFISFGEALFAAHAALGRARPPAEWTQLFERLLQNFLYLDDPETAPEAQALRTAWQAMGDAAAEAACDEAVPLAVVQRSLDDALQAVAPGWAFFGGGITFAALRAHRAVPVPVLCLLGLNDGEFPRNPAMPDFDLTVRHPRAGDRAYREEDRHAFLEALLSVREVLHLSYVGRDVRDNSALPPSTVLAELIDVLQRRHITAEGGDVLDQIRIEHPLQAFSRRYFEAADQSPRPLYSYDAELAAAAQAARSVREGAGRPFLQTTLPEEAEATTTLSLDELVRFLQNPARRLLQGRLGIQLAESEGLLDSTEPFLLDGLDRYGLDQQLLDAQVRGVGGLVAGEALQRARAAGLLPTGAAGDTQFHARWQSVAALARRITAAGLQPAHPSISFEAHGITLSGTLPALDAQGLLLWRPAKAPGARDWLRLWVYHLALQIAAEDDATLGRHSRLLTLEDEALLLPVADAADQLADLIALWRWAGRELLPFFPATSLAWFEQESRWQRHWDGDGQSERSEQTDPWFNLAFAGTVPFDERFEALAEQIYAPLIAARAG